MKSILKWTIRILLAIVVILVVTGFALLMVGGSKATKSYVAEGMLTSVPTDSSAIQHGERLSKALGCASCHGDNLAGQVLGDEAPFLLAPANITGGKGSATANYRTEDWDRAIRHGLRPDGTPILIMPSRSYHKLADSDIADLIAYLQTVQPVDNEVPKSELRAMGKVLVAFGVPFYETELGPTDVVAPPVGPTAEYGSYLASAMCASCHGKNFEGGPSPDPDLPAPSLASASKWTQDTFIRVLRTGVRPNGDSLNVEAMPYDIFEHWTDDEITAVHAYLRTVIE